MIPSRILALSVVFIDVRLIFDRRICFVYSFGGVAALVGKLMAPGNRSPIKCILQCKLINSMQLLAAGNEYKNSPMSEIPFHFHRTNKRIYNSMPFSHSPNGIKFSLHKKNMKRRIISITSFQNCSYSLRDRGRSEGLNISKKCL